MNNKQLYIISNQQRFTFNSWKVIVPYTHVHFPVYLTNPYQLTYRRAGYIRGQSYNYSIGQQTFTFDMGVHLNPTLPNVGLYNHHHTLSWSHTWSAYPSMNKQTIYENNYTNCNLPYLPGSKYQGYNNSGNRVFYDLMVHTLRRRYYTKAAKSYVTSGLDNIISTYTPLTAGILNHPSCIYYLLSPQLYHTWLLTHKGQIKTPTIYLRSLLQEYIYTCLWSINFAKLWCNLPCNQVSVSKHMAKLAHIGKVHLAVIAKVAVLLSYKYIAMMSNYPAVTPGCITEFFHATAYSGGVMRIPITQSLTFLSALQVSIPKKRLWGMGSWGVNYLEYYTPRTTAVMHGTGITSKLPMNKYTRVTGKSQGGRALTTRVYRGLLTLPATLQAQPYCFSYARILQSLAPVCYHSSSRITNKQLTVYSGAQPVIGTRIHFATAISLWTNVWVKLYKHSLVKYTQVRVTRAKFKSNVKSANKKHQLPHAHKLWYNRMLPNKRKNK